jgi:hypothetical protein
MFIVLSSVAPTPIDASEAMLEEDYGAARAGL